MSELTQSERDRRERIRHDFTPAWDAQRKIQLDAEDRFSKFILTVAAGSFGVSFAFINQIIPVPIADAKETIMLIIAWGFMGFTVLLGIIETLITYFVQDKLLDNIELNIKRGYEWKKYINTSKVGIMFPDRIIKGLTLLSFLSGISFLLYFVYRNIVY